MGILKKIEENNCIIAIWDLQESLEELMQQSDDITPVAVWTTLDQWKQLVSPQSILGITRQHGLWGSCSIQYCKGSKKIAHKLDLRHQNLLVSLHLKNAPNL